MPYLVVGQYLWWIVFSFYQQLKEEVNRETEPLLPNGHVTQGRIQTSVLGGAINIGLMGPMGGAILRNPYLSHVNFSVLGGAIAPTAPPPGSATDVTIVIS